MVIGFVVVSTVRATEIKRDKCDFVSFKENYLKLVDNERAIREAFNKIVDKSGTSDVSHCVVEYPIENGIPVPGRRRISLDIRWDRYVIINGIKIPDPQQHGMTIEYDMKRDYDGSETREVVSLVICRSLETCQKLGIPLTLN